MSVKILFKFYDTNIPFSDFMWISKVKGSPTVTGPEVLEPAVPNPLLTSI